VDPVNSASSGDPADAGPTMAATAPRPTTPGIVLGTVGYKAPEQARGLPADLRADIFAFGVVFYEMLAGARAFRRGTTIDTIAAILNEDPPAFPKEGERIPPAVERIVHRCLEKQPALRFKSADDLTFALETLSSPSTKLTAIGAAATAPGSSRPRPRQARWSIWCVRRQCCTNSVSTIGPASCCRRSAIRVTTPTSNSLPMIRGWQSPSSSPANDSATSG
jgi:serine/threonine protein kinase